MISITWIGFKLQASWYSDHKIILDEILKDERKIVNLSKSVMVESNLQSPKTPDSELLMFNRNSSIRSMASYVREYAITKIGEPICLNEYAADILN